MRLARVLPRRAPLQAVDAALRKGDMARAIAVLDDLLAGKPTHAAELLRLKAELLLKGGEAAAAETVCRQVQDSKPTAWALALLGQIALQHRQLAAAERFFRDAITLTPAYMAAHDGLATVLEADGRQQEALAVLVAAVERSAKSLPRQLHLAWLAQELEQLDIAERAWRRALALARQMEQDQPAYHAAFTATLAAKGAYRDAQAAAKKLAQEFRLHAEVPWWTLAAKLHILAAHPGNERENLLQEFDNLLQGGPPPAAAMTPLGAALRALGEEKRAAQLG